MANKFEVSVYEDHYIVKVTTGQLVGGPAVAEKGCLEEMLDELAAAGSPSPEKKRTYPRGVRRARKPKAEAATAGTEAAAK